jgi:hypothetical protein
MHYIMYIHISSLEHKFVGIIYVFSYTVFKNVTSCFPCSTYTHTHTHTYIFVSQIKHDVIFMK